MPRSSFLIIVAGLCLAMQAQAPNLTVTAQNNFNQSDAQFQRAEGQIHRAIVAVKTRLAQSPAEAASLNAQLAMLEKLLQHTQLLEQQAAQTKAPTLAKIKAGVALNAQEIATTTKSLNVLVSQAQADAAEASSMNVPIQVGSAAPPPEHRHNAAPEAPAQPSEEIALPPPPPPPPMAAAAPQPLVAGATGAGPGMAGGGSQHGDLSEEEAKWFAGLQKGALQYIVPDIMEWKVPSTITVTVSGPKSAPTPLAGANGQAMVPVSSKMIVRPSCPGSPDEFSFTPLAGTTDEQFVPENGTTTWQWSTIPNYTGKPQTIVIEAWVVFSDKHNVQQALPVYNAQVQIQVSPGTLVKRLLEGDPDYWIKYGMPGGAGFVFVSGLVGGFWGWFRKKKKKKETSAAETERAGAADDADFGG